MKKIFFSVLIFTITSIPIETIAKNQNDPGHLTQENWKRHPRIVEIRSIYKKIRKAIEKKKLTYIEKNFSKLPRNCRGTYPIERVAVAYDSKGRVRLYVFAQRISHDDLQTTEYYYNQNGKLRFVFMSNKSQYYATIENRVYLNEDAEVFWDVEKELKKLTYGEVTSDPHQIREISTKGLKESVKQTKVKCSE